VQLLLTSAGDQEHEHPRRADRLLGKPVAESSALCIPTASYGHPMGGPAADHEDLPDNSMAEAEKWAANLPVPGYAIDDQTAIKVTGGTVEVVSEGHWKLVTPKAERLSGFTRDLWRDLGDEN